MAEKKQFGELLVGFELIEGHGMWKSPHGSDPHRSPIFPLGCGWVGEGRFDDFSEADHCPFVNAVVVKNGIPEFHLAQKVPSLIVTDSIPNDLLFL